MEQLKKSIGNTNTSSGFNFNYTVFSTLKKGWWEFKKRYQYEKEYISESGNRADSLEALKKLEDEH